MSTPNPHYQKMETSENQELRSRESSQSSNSSSHILKQCHKFHPTTFTRPTYCDLCSNFIWGVVMQGYECSECGYNSHKKCSALVITPCFPASCSRISNESIKSIHSTQFPITPPTTPATGSKTADLKSRTSYPTQIKRTNSIVTELFAETQKQSRILGNALEENSPALNMTVMLRQNNRFLARQGPMIWFNENMIKLLTWHSVPNTLIFLLSYIIICILI